MEHKSIECLMLFLYQTSYAYVPQRLQLQLRKCFSAGGTLLRKYRTRWTWLDVT